MNGLVLIGGESTGVVLADGFAEFAGFVDDDAAAEAGDEGDELAPSVDVQDDAECPAGLVVDLGVGFEAEAEHLLAVVGGDADDDLVGSAPEVLQCLDAPALQVERVLGVGELQVGGDETVDVVELVAQRGLSSAWPPDREQAVAQLERATGIDPVDEDLYRRRMQIYADLVSLLDRYEVVFDQCATVVDKLELRQLRDGKGGTIKGPNVDRLELLSSTNVELGINPGDAI